MQQGFSASGSESVFGVEWIASSEHGEKLALIVRAIKQPDGITFLTPDESIHQLGVLSWRKGHKIDAHVHNPITRTINSTEEVLFVRSGSVRVDLYSADQRYECSRILGAGYVIFLSSGGHGFEILEDADIVEVKQGPYTGENEKTRFEPRDNPHWTESP